MNKNEFLDGLRNQLTGQMAEGKILAHVRYYQEYIETQISNGKSESEAVAELGAPQLIAKTLLDTEAVNSGEADRYSTNKSGTGDYNRYSSEEYDRYEANEYDVTYGDDFSSTHRQEGDGYEQGRYAYGQDGYVKKRTWHLDLSTWYGKLLVIAIAFLIIGALIFIIGTIIPILIVAFLILSVISYFKKRKRK